MEYKLYEKIWNNMKYWYTKNELYEIIPNNMKYEIIRNNMKEYEIRNNT